MASQGSESGSPPCRGRAKVVDPENSRKPSTKNHLVENLDFAAANGTSAQKKYLQIFENNS